VKKCVEEKIILEETTRERKFYVCDV